MRNDQGCWGFKFIAKVIPDLSLQLHLKAGTGFESTQANGSGRLRGHAPCSTNARGVRVMVKQVSAATNKRKPAK